MRTEIKESYLSSFLQLRLLVGFLGERAQFAWWPTAFYESSGRLFLEPVFSKTAHLAQYHGVLEAARRLHDEHLSVGSYHLFRLTEEVEQDIHALAQTMAGEKQVYQVPQSKEAALDALRHAAGLAPSFDAGPINIGSIADIESVDTLKTIAGAYLSAFSQGGKTYPYLAS
jgi:hypothetical protein